MARRKDSDEIVVAKADVIRDKINMGSSFDTAATSKPGGDAYLESPRAFTKRAPQQKTSLMESTFDRIIESNFPELKVHHKMVMKGSSQDGERISRPLQTNELNSNPIGEVTNRNTDYDQKISCPAGLNVSLGSSLFKS